VFNEANSRKPEELNIFDGVSRNRLFLGVVGITVVLQVWEELTRHQLYELFLGYFIRLAVFSICVSGDNY
jgi:hypothetical protein